MPENVELDIAALQAELANLSEEDLRAQLIEYKTKQKVATKKYSNPQTAKAYRDRVAAKRKLMTEMAEKLGLMDAINAEANKRAEAKLAADKAKAESEEDELAAVAGTEE